MKVRLDGNDPCRYWVSSESDGGVEYIVDLCENPLGPDADGVMEFNGSCGLAGIHGCSDFMYRCAPQLKKPENHGKIYRCKHLRAARGYALSLLLPHLNKHRVNIHEDYQT